RFRKTESLYLHDKGKCVATSPAAKAMKDLTRRVDIEGRGLLGMKRAETRIVGAGASQLNVVGNNLQNGEAFSYLAHLLLWNHGCAPVLPRNADSSLSPTCANMLA